MECEICGRGPQSTGDALYRANDKGVLGRWRCKHHLNERASNVAHSDIGDLVRTIEAGSRTQNENTNDL